MHTHTDTQEEIDRLRVTIDSLRSGDVEKKYLDALRKLKGVSVKYESERAKVSKLTKQVIDCDARLREAESAQPAAAAAQARVSTGASETSGGEHSPHNKALLRELREKLDKTQKVNAEMKRQQVALKQDMIRLRDVLKREVGDQIDVQALLSQAESDATGAKAAQDGWRGRAQSISLLKQKVKGLQRQLADATGAGAGAGAIAPSDSASQVCGQTSATVSQCGGNADGATGVASNRDFDDVNRMKLSEVTSARKGRETEQKRTIDVLHKNVSEWKERHAAAAARIGTFETELSGLKMQLARVLQKTENDDKLVEAYRSELDALRAGYKRALAEQGAQQRTAHSPPACATVPGVVDNAPSAAGEAAHLLADVDHAKNAKMHDLDERVYKEVVTHSGRVLEALRGAEGGGRASLAGLYRAELGRHRSYCDLLRIELAEERQRCELLEDSLNREVHRPPHGAPPFDPNALPPQVVSHVSILKGEISSLKERVKLATANHDAELSVFQHSAAEQEEAAAAAVRASEQRVEELETAYEVLCADHEGLKTHFREVKKELAKLSLNAEA